MSRPLPHPENSPASTSYHQLIHLISTTFEALNLTPESEEIEAIGRLVYEAMSSSARYYHRPEHVLEISKDTHPIQSFALLFHDVIYLQVDQGIHEALKPFLEHVKINPDFSVQFSLEKEFEFLSQLFQLKQPHHCTLTEGANEFLSAIIAVRALKKYLSQWQLIQIAACIEATIPFRMIHEDGTTCFDMLFQRLKSLNPPPDVTESEIEQTLHLAVDVANRDVGGFASAQPEFFIEQTWNLVLEGNMDLKDPLFTIQHYRSSLQKIQHFHQHLKVDRIFHQFLGKPSEAEVHSLIQQTLKNRAVQDEYIQITLLELGILEAISELTGGDAPYLLFTGDSGQKLLNLKHQSYTDLTLLLELNRAFLERKVSPLTYLQSIDLGLLTPILETTGKLALSRSSQIKKLSDLLLLEKTPSEGA